MQFTVEFWYENEKYSAGVWYITNEDTFEVDTVLDSCGNVRFNLYLEELAIEEAKEALWEYIKKCKEENEYDHWE